MNYMKIQMSATSLPLKLDQIHYQLYNQTWTLAKFFQLRLILVIPNSWQRLQSKFLSVYSGINYIVCIYPVLEFRKSKLNIFKSYS